MSGVRFLATTACLVFMFVIAGCNPAPVASTPTPVIETSNLPTPASTLSELIRGASSEDMAVRLVSIYALESYSSHVDEVTPLLIENLKSNDSDIREAAAYVLGTFGSKANIAVPDLIILLKDRSSHVKREAIIALEFIGDTTAVPDLANMLFIYEKDFLGINAAEAISSITGENFSNSGRGVYEMNEQGITLIVLDAQKWWEEEGQFQDWDNQ